MQSLIEIRAALAIAAGSQRLEGSRRQRRRGGRGGKAEAERGGGGEEKELKRTRVAEEEEEKGEAVRIHWDPMARPGLLAEGIPISPAYPPGFAGDHSAKFSLASPFPSL